MTSKNVKPAFIENDTARKEAYKKREKGLVKMVDELTTLCGIDACAIIYSPYDPQPEIWPSPSGVEKVLSKLKTMTEMEQSKKMVNQESFLKERISKAEKQFEKLREDNREKETTMVMFQCLKAGNVLQNDMSMEDLNNLDWMIDMNLKEVYRRIESAENEINIPQNQSESQVMAAQSQVHLQMTPPPPPPPPSSAPNNDEIAMMSHDHAAMAMDNDDMNMMFMEMMMMNGGENQSESQVHHQMTPPPALLPPPPPPLPLLPRLLPPPTTPNNEENAMMSHGDVGMAMNNDDVMLMEMMMRAAEYDETIPFGYDANLDNGF
ncbi:unnamed protein product [Lathyrus sativus]|nr:unnamed protein product [Lathyrus sativus]